MIKDLPPADINQRIFKLSLSVLPDIRNPLSSYEQPLIARDINGTLSSIYRHDVRFLNSPYGWFNPRMAAVARHLGPALPRYAAHDLLSLLDEVDHNYADELIRRRLVHLKDLQRTGSYDFRSKTDDLLSDLYLSGTKGQQALKRPYSHQYAHYLAGVWISSLGLDIDRLAVSPVAKLVNLNQKPSFTGNQILDSLIAREYRVAKNQAILESKSLPLE